jgi:hypothetical protein
MSLAVRKNHVEVVEVLRAHSLEMTGAAFA